MKKKSPVFFLCMLCAVAVSAQTVQENDTDIPFDQDLSASVVQSSGDAGNASSVHPAKHSGRS